MGNAMQPSTSMSEALELWLARRAASGKISTASFRPYRQHFRAATNFLGDVPICDVTPEMTARYQLHLNATLSPRTTYTRIGVLMDFFRDMVRLDVLEADPTRALERKAPPKTLPRPAPPHVAASLMAGSSPRTALMVALGAHVGLRRFEIAKVRRSDFNLAERQLNVYNGKGGKDAVLPISEDVVRLLGEYVEAVGIAPNGWLFPSDRRPGEHLSPGQVGRAITEASHRIGEHVTPHRYRHQAGTEMTKHAGIKAAQTLLRHSSSATTDIYSAFDTQDLQRQVDSLHRPDAA